MFNPKKTSWITGLRANNMATIKDMISVEYGLDSESL